MKRGALILVCGLALLSTSSPLAFAQHAVAAPGEVPGLDLLLRRLDRTHRLLYVTAHPDDEDAGLLARLSLGEGIACALMTLTRGEGGQNEIGRELGAALGTLRSRELEAASRWHGARQLFGRALDFGYSFSVEETFAKWDRERVVEDVGTVIRRVRPDVVITLTPTGEGGGQHHQAAALLTLEAVERAARSDQPWAEKVPHRVARVFRQIWRSGDRPEHTCELELGTFDDALGMSWAECGDIARAQHRCQGMLRLAAPFPERVSRLEWIAGLDGEPRAVSHPFEGLPQPFLDGAAGPTRLGTLIRREAAAIRRQLAAGRREPAREQLVKLAALGEDDPAWRDSIHRSRLRESIAAALQHLSGLRLAARSDRPSVREGGRVGVTVTLANAGGTPLPVRWRLVGPGLDERPIEATIGAGERREASRELVLGGARWTIDRPAADEDGVDPRWAPFTLEAELFGLPLPPVRVEHVSVDDRFPRWIRRDLHVVPDPSARFARPVVAVPAEPGEPLEVGVEVLVSALDAGRIDYRVEMERPWASRASAGSASPAGREVSAVVVATAPPGTVGRSTFTVTTTPAGERSGGFRPVEHPHIRPGAILRPAETTVVAFPCRRGPRRSVGYVAGTGDAMAETVARLGHELHELTRADLLDGDLSRLDVIVLGVRAYKVRDDLKAAHSRLLAWMRKGGVLIVQYNKLEMNGERAGGESWFPVSGARVTRRRVTVEESPVKLRRPDHAIFSTPNRLGSADWKGWVQERGLYFLDTPPVGYQDLLQLEDPWPYNAGPQGGALVEARVGEGAWIYVGLALFRQLPAAVPGAWRLWANLLARRPVP